MIKPVFDKIKAIFKTKFEPKTKPIEYPHAESMARVFFEHAHDMSTLNHYYESINAAYLAEAKRGNWLENNSPDSYLIYLPRQTARRVLEKVIGYSYSRDQEAGIEALKSCLDIIMERKEVEPWYIWKELNKLANEQTHGDGKPDLEWREIVFDGMRYLGEKEFLIDEKKLKQYITEYNNSMGWDAALSNWETRQSRQEGIDRGIEKEMKEIMDIHAPYLLHKQLIHELPDKEVSKRKMKV